MTPPHTPLVAPLELADVPDVVPESVDDQRIGPSSKPHPPSPSTRLPNELLEVVFNLARPALVAPSSAWASFRRLSEVCAAWTPAAQRALGKHVVLARAGQVGHLATALETAIVDPDRVQSLMLNLHTPNEPEPTLSELRAVIDRCPNLDALRLKGFGESAIVADHPRFFRGSTTLDKLRTLEYAPVDHASPATTEAVLGWLHDLPSLEALELASHLVPLSLHPANPFYPPLAPHASLTTLSLHSVRLDVATFSLIAASSLTSLRTLALRESYLVVPAPGPLQSLFDKFGPNLTALAWENKLHPDVGGSATPADYWALLSSCTALRTLALFSRHVFVDRPAEFRLPPSLEELSVGARGPLSAASVWGMFDLATLASPTPSTFHSLSNLSQSPPPPAPTTQTERRHRRGRRDRERAREKGKRHPSSSGCSTPTPAPAPVLAASPTRLQKLSLWSDGERWPAANEYKLQRQGSVRGVAVSWYRLHIVTVDVLEQTAELRRASSR